MGLGHTRSVRASRARARHGASHRLAETRMPGPLAGRGAVWGVGGSVNRPAVPVRGGGVDGLNEGPVRLSAASATLAIAGPVAVLLWLSLIVMAMLTSPSSGWV